MSVHLLRQRGTCSRLFRAPESFSLYAVSFENLTLPTQLLLAAIEKGPHNVRPSSETA